MTTSASVPATNPSPRAALADGAQRLGIALSGEQLDRFDQYAALLAAGKAAFNLTALTDPLDVAIKHFLDALTVLSLLPPGPLWVIDVGSGAGFPGLPLKIVRPELRLTLLEATGKKASWMGRTAEALGLSGVEAIAERAETLGHDAHHRQRYDVAVARAVAPFPVLCELALPFVQAGGHLIAQKTTNALEAEVPGAKQALKTLGARLQQVQHVSLPELPNRILIVVEQTGQVPTPYPRRPGLPAKRPL